MYSAVSELCYLYFYRVSYKWVGELYVVCMLLS